MTYLRVERGPQGWVTRGAPAYRASDGLGEHGTLACWSTDAASGTVTVDTDRWGYRPLYYHAGRDRLVLADDLLECLDGLERVTLDHEAVAVFVRCGYLVGDRTPFAGVRAVPPRGFRWQAGRLRRPPPPPAPTATEMTRDAAVDCYIDLFRAAIGRRAPGGRAFALPLSGGRDSRHILLELCHQGTPPAVAVTAGKRYGVEPDVVCARALTATLGIRHRTLRPVVPTRAREREKNLATNLSVDEGLWYSTVRRFLDGTPLSYDGLAGDILSNGVYCTEDLLDLFHAHRWQEIAERMLGYGEGTVRRAISPATLRRAPRELAVAAMAAEVSRHVADPNPIGSFYFWHRTRRELGQGAFAWMRGVVPMHTPYLDRDLVTFLFTLPAKMMLGHDFHDEVMERAYPALAHVPYLESAPVRHGVLERRLSSAPRRAVAAWGAARLRGPHRAGLARAMLSRGARTDRMLALACWEEQVLERLRP